MATTALFDQIAGYLTVAGQHFESEPDQGLIVAHMGGEHGTWHTYIQITDDVEVRHVVIHAHLPALVPVNTRLKVAELLTRINYDLAVGNFELGLDDGELLFKTAVDLADGQLTEAMFERMYQLNCQVMNEHYGQIWNIAFGDVDVNLDKGQVSNAGAFLQ
ncbi:MAG: YbjN domain-containing protein [Polaromonas sp.]|uniref:YbjN domain-containing protein n=1 Tax=Polaromonas sp. TaxID=1869339 RepID=UPI002730D6A0|nr:YbjN domain-containing protein [Polaromonas sp.]MDP2448612.1 YbjN domain-containing protein [Polaromonas sp.]MDP3245810.1 YbjN domain-containing protein [Polaromonas sp.]MDP3757377.1 YbjN domain-containing protein [Polaromonas sp.]